MRFPIRMLRIAGMLVLLGLFLGTSGCSSVSGVLKDPEVRLVKVDVVKAKLLEQRFLLHFRVDNSNPVSLPIRGLSYDLMLDDIPFTEGESSEWFTVPAHGSQTFTVPVTTNLWRHVKSVVRMLDDPGKPIRYRLTGEVKLGMLFGQHVQVSRNGEIIPGDYLPE